MLYKLFNSFIAIIVAMVALPAQSLALEMPGSAKDMAQYEEFTAKSYIVLDAKTGEQLLAKDTEQLWVPASLTKLVTALVVLDAKPNLKKSIAMAKDDEVGGARIATRAGVKYTVSDLLHASLIASANNATNALSRSIGLSKEDFVARMNAKAKELGAASTVFYEPTGIDPRNMTTASDYARITKAAFSNPSISKIAKLQKYSFRSTNNRKYSHSIKSTNKLLGDAELGSVVGKTGYLDESRYNFVAEVNDRLGNDFIVVVLGSSNSAAQFQETKKLTLMGTLAKAFFSPNNGTVLGSVTTTPVSGVSIVY
jgi:serine-type D-Ala-D-Ala endopeptidase (penicillin-binding protein 7)